MRDHGRTCQLNHTGRAVPQVQIRRELQAVKGTFEELGKLASRGEILSVGAADAVLGVCDAHDVLMWCWLSWPLSDASCRGADGGQASYIHGTTS